MPIPSHTSVAGTVAIVTGADKGTGLAHLSVELRAKVLSTLGDRSSCRQDGDPHTEKEEISQVYPAVGLCRSPGVRRGSGRAWRAARLVAVRRRAAGAGGCGAAPSHAARGRTRPKLAVCSVVGEATASAWPVQEVADMSSGGFPMLAPQVTSVAARPSVSAALPATEEHELRFRDVLSALNPLQYLPGVGTICRAVTGDSPPEPIRVIGSIIVSGLLGGPVGAAISAVSSLVQHMAGIDLDHVAHDVLADIGLADDAPSQPIAAALPAPAPPAPTGAHSATAAEAPIAIWCATPEPEAEIQNSVQLQAALAAYARVPAPYGIRLGQV